MITFCSLWNCMIKSTIWQGLPIKHSTSIPFWANWDQSNPYVSCLNRLSNSKLWSNFFNKKFPKRRIISSLSFTKSQGTCSVVWFRGSVLLLNIKYFSFLFSLTSIVKMILRMKNDQNNKWNTIDVDNNRSGRRLHISWCMYASIKIASTKQFPLMIYFRVFYQNPVIGLSKNIFSGLLWPKRIPSRSVSFKLRWFGPFI